MKKAFIMAVITALAFTDCQNVEEIKPDTSSNITQTQERLISDIGESSGSYCGTPHEVKLLAGQYIEVGTVRVTNDEHNLYVRYHLTSDEWEFGTLHLFVGDYAETPLTKGGSPVPGRFPYKVDIDGKAASYTFTIPLSGIPDCYIVAAQAEVNGHSKETAWGYGTSFVEKGNWGTYFNDCKDICGGLPAVVKTNNTPVQQ